MEQFAGRDSQLLPHQKYALAWWKKSTPISQYRYADQPRAWIQEPPLPAPQSTADGRDPNRTRRIQKGRVEWGLLQIPAHSPFLVSVVMSSLRLFRLA